MHWFRRALPVILVASVASLSAQAPSTLDIYWIDVEGGAATLIVTPNRETILMDTGWERPDGRDAERVAAAMQDAGVESIDYFIASHFHGDHVGGLAALTQLVEVGQFIDHGDSVEQDQPRGRRTFEGYLQVAEGRRRTVAPGDRLPVRGIDFSFVAGRGAVRERTSSMGPNVLCTDADPGPHDTGENGQSLGYLLSLGAFQFLNLGDLTLNGQHRLACPESILGMVDVFQIPHHGNGVAPQLTWALSPAVAVMANGPRKGGSAAGYDVVAQTPGLQRLWQLHRSLDTDAAHNAADPFIANVTDEEECDGHWIKASVNPDGRSYVLTNRRTGVSETYVSR